MKSLKTISAVFTALSMVLVLSVAQAITYDFENITNNGLVDLTGTGQLTVDVTGSDADGYAYFTFNNNLDIAGSTDSSITSIYFDYDTSLTTVDFFAQTGATATNGSGKATEGVLFSEVTAGNADSTVGLNTVSFTTDYASDSDAPASKLGVNHEDEFITFMAVLGSGYDFLGLLDAIGNNEFRIGMHLTSILGSCGSGDGSCSDSDTYVNTPNVVPVPAAAWLFGTALFGFFAASRRKKIS